MYLAGREEDIHTYIHTYIYRYLAGREEDIGGDELDALALDEQVPSPRRRNEFSVRRNDNSIFVYRDRNPGM
jgi:hypothetical protein